MPTSQLKLAVGQPKGELKQQQMYRCSRDSRAKGLGTVYRAVSLAVRVAGERLIGVERRAGERGRVKWTSLAI